MFDTLDFAEDILAQEADRMLGQTRLNRQHLTAIISYQHLTDNWDENEAVAPLHQTVLTALDIALLLTVTEQPIYHTSPGPNGEIMINLRNGAKSVELLTYPGGRNKFVQIGPGEPPKQDTLTPDKLRETLQWINQ